jgi:triacylglycerol lipase
MLRVVNVLRERMPLPFLPDPNAKEQSRALRDDPIWHGDGAPRGDGTPVLLVGGFGAPECVLRRLVSWLEQLGYVVEIAQLRHGLDCGERSAESLEKQLASFAGDQGRPVLMIAHSRGGQFARVVGVRRPDLVAGLITLGTPFEVFALRRPVRIQAALIGIAGTLGVPNLVSFNCLRGACCAVFRRDLSRPWPAGVPLTCVFSPVDRTVRPETCVDPAAECISVPHGHVAMLASPASYRAIARGLAVHAQRCPPTTVFDTHAAAPAMFPLQ